MPGYNARKADEPDAFAILQLDTIEIPLDAAKFLTLYDTLPRRVEMTRSRQGTHVSLRLANAWHKVPIDETGTLIDDLNRILAEDISSSIDQFGSQP